MSEDVPEYHEAMHESASRVLKYLEEPDPGHITHTDLRGRILLSLWPKHSLFEGKRTDPDDKYKCPNPTLLNLEICDAELLVAEWSRMPNYFEQEASRSVQAALREREEQLTREDMSYAED
jgi:hypothetical protein